MFAYLYCQQTVESNILLPELPAAIDGKAAFLFHLESAQPPFIHLDWRHHWSSPAGEPILSYGRQGSVHWLHFPAVADFRILSNTRVISCYPLPEIPQETVRHLFLDQVLPRCLAHQGKIIVHASAVQIEQGLLLFIGDSGAGKSTLAGNFHRAGDLAISDDCVWMKEVGNRIVVVPSYNGLRLWEDSLGVLFATTENAQPMAHYSSKKRIPLDQGQLRASPNGMPVLAVILLSPPRARSASQVTLERLSHRETFIAMLKQSFQLDMQDMERMMHHMQALGCLVPRVPAFRLSMPRDYDLLPLVRQQILETVL